MIKKKCIEKRKQQLLIEFREFLYSLIVCLGAGYSFENSLPHTVEELEMLYSGDSMIVEEIRHIHRRVTLGESAESAFRQFSERADCTAIHLFVSTLGIGLKQGGNLVEILKENGNMIIDQLATHQEIEVITAEKQFELKVLSCFPIFMIAVLDYSSPNYMAVLYQTWFGRIGMTLAMIVIGFGIWLGRELVMRHT
ncbi:MAG: type II secretion system F family protein [Clostridia bacterium]|nr:type II secretion system F family protein [Clostridia bacterium]